MAEGTVEGRLHALETEQVEARAERRELRTLIEAQSKELTRLIDILDTITRIRNLLAWLSPVFTVIGFIVGWRA